MTFFQRTAYSSIAIMITIVAVSSTVISFASAFTVPYNHQINHNYRRNPSSSSLHAIPIFPSIPPAASTLSQSILINLDTVIDITDTSASISTPAIEVTTAATSAGIEEAFTDEIVFFDPTIQILAITSLVLILLAAAAKFFLNQMDAAIENVLVDFERTLKTKYASRWVSIENKLEGLVEPERAQVLFQIMEDLQEREPDFMAQVNRDMNKN